MYLTKQKNLPLFFLLTFFVCIYSYGQTRSNFIKLDKTFRGSCKIAEDKFGFIWISSLEGLYKYDGYDFDLISYNTLFNNDNLGDREYLLTKDKSDNLWLSSYRGELLKIGFDGKQTSFKDSFSNNKPQQITSIKSLDKNVWLGSANGNIYKYNSLTSEIDSIFSLPKINNVNQRIVDIAFTSKDKIWVSTRSGKVYDYSISKKTLSILNGPLKLNSQLIYITNDNEGNLWLASELQGLFVYNPKTKKFKQYKKTNYSSTELKHDMFIYIFCDSFGNIWAGTDGDGLYKIDKKTDQVTVFKHDETNKFSISNNTITYINEDSKGNIWIVDKKGVVNVLPKSNSNISYYNGLESNAPTKVLSILKSSDGSLWFGTDGKGLNRVYPNQTKVQYSNNKKGDFFFKGRYVQKLIEDPKGNIWIGTYQNGLWVLNPKNNTFKKVNTVDSKNNYSPDIRHIFKDDKDRIWVSSLTALHVFSVDQKIIATFNYDSNGLFGKPSMSICQDKYGTIWLGLNPGILFKFNEDVNNFQKSYFTKQNYYLKQNGDSRNYNIHSITAEQDNLWIICASGILINYNIKNGTFKTLSDQKPLSSVNISSLLIEDSTNFWLSSNNGLHHYQLKDNTIKSYYQIDGFHTDDYTKRSAYKSLDGTFYFGSDNGVNSFLPKNIDQKDNDAKLYISNIEILNKPANEIIPEQVENGVERVKKIELSSNESSFSFQFAAIENVLNPNYHYAYKLEGFDKNWITPKRSRIASYTNIPYGKYTLKVKAGSKQGVWDIDTKEINIKINAPWWFSNLAIFIYVLLGAALIYGVIIWLRLKNKLAAEAWQNNKEKELYALKMNFFAKMSHEIQTPLTLILGPISNMLERAEANKNQLLRQRLLIINNNANRLSRIAMELMTLRNKELGKLKVLVSKNDLIAHLKKIAISFSEQARFKKIDFIQEFPNDTPEIWYDKDKIEHVVYNLLSNAFKFTPKEGVITLKVTINSDDETLDISVTDSGPGIPKDELEDIFELFYQSNLGKHEKGMGVGLALTKEMISLHKGSINVESSPEKGTCFSVKLSTNDSVFSDDEKVFVKDDARLTSETIDNDFQTIEKQLNKESSKKSEKNTLF